MIDLRTHISEAISHGKHKSPEPKYTPFPKKRTDKEAILNWLMTNGFVEVRGNLDTDTLVKHYDETGEKCFHKSTYTPNRNTHWIRFYDGKDAFMIRTCLVRDLPRGTVMCSIYPDVKIHTYYGKGITFEEIKKHFDEQLTLESCISEAVSHGYKRSKTIFPDRPDKEEVIDWLEANGYDEVKDPESWDSNLLVMHHRKTGNKCYMLGAYDSPVSSWIMFYNGDLTVLLRTSGGERHGHVYCYNGVVTNNVTFDRLKKEIEKNLK